MAPQTFHAVLCVSCKSFQVHIVKISSNKWNCKVCGTKQSVGKVHAKGSAKECREIVQQLNIARGELEELRSLELASCTLALEESEEKFVDFNLDNDTPSTSRASNSFHQIHHRGVIAVPAEASKWRVFLE